MVNLSIDLPVGFLNKEVICGFEVSEKRKEIWAVELDLLYIFDKTCKKYNITYFVDSGTLLGTIRHHGFIPWDDDIDVIMSRKDYNKLCKIALKEFEYPYFFQTEYSDPGSLRGHAQLRNSETTAILMHESNRKYSFNQGIFIDIFIFDNCPEDQHKQLIFSRNTNRIRDLSYGFASISSRYFVEEKPDFKDHIKKILFLLIGKHITINPFYWLWEKSIQKYNNMDTKIVANYVWWKLMPYMISEKSWYDSAITMKFESLDVPVPIGYQEMLRRRYGNWEQPLNNPSIHGDVLFDTNIPYTEYLQTRYY